MAFGILIPLPGIKTMSPAMEVWILNHWTAREVPGGFPLKGTNPNLEGSTLMT